MRLAPTPLPTALLAGLLLACAGDQRGSVVDTANAQAMTRAPAATSERRVVDEIIPRGSVRRAWVGLDVAGAEAMHDWKAQGGVLVRQVALGGPAAQAGIAVTSAEDAARLLQSIRPRQAFRLYFERNGQTGYTDLAFP